MEQITTNISSNAEGLIDRVDYESTVNSTAPTELTLDCSSNMAEVSDVLSPTSASSIFSAECFSAGNTPACESGTFTRIKKNNDRRREQNRAAQRAYRDRQRVLVDGLTAQVQDLTIRLKQESTKCQLLESMYKRLATENEVYREFLKLERNKSP